MKALTCTALAAAFAVASFAAEKVATKTIRYEIDGDAFESSIVYHPDADAKQPGILMVPNWMGPTAAALEKAQKVAANGYVVMVVDMYGVDVRPANAQEAGAAAGTVRADREMMRERARKALDRFKSEGEELGLDKSKLAAIGFCFGGGTVLELGRSGAKLDAIVSFHGDLLSPTLESDAGETKAKVLVLHGADDPYVPQADVSRWMAVMAETDVDWQLTQFSDTVHSFTDPLSNSEGARYNETSARRAFQSMNALLSEVWAEK